MSMPTDAGGPNDSDISGAAYGYDFVVAVTQISINATMKCFLASLTEPVVTGFFVLNEQGVPQLIPYNKLQELAKGSDPFTIPNGATPADNADIENLMGARFLAGFKARLGLPRVDPSKLPDLVTLGDEKFVVLFKMLCSEFTIVELRGSMYELPVWFSQSQDPTNPWVFASKVDMHLSTVDDSAFSTLPAAVQHGIKNMGDNAFSVQQLLFDLTNPSLETVPQIDNVPHTSVLYGILTQYFVNGYFLEMRKEHQPLLGCCIAAKNPPASSLTLTDFNFEVSPYIDSSGQPYNNPTQKQQHVATLNYLCAVQHHTLPPAVRFRWNWVVAARETKQDGTMAINRNTLTTYFYAELAPLVTRNCIKMSVNMSLNSLSQPQYNWTPIRGQKPTVDRPPTGKTVLSFSYSSNNSDIAGLGGDLGAMTMRPSYKLTVDFVANGTAPSTIVVTQSLLIWVSLRYLQTTVSGNLVNRKVVDTYKIEVDSIGQLGANGTSESFDSPDLPTTNPILNEFTNINSRIADIETLLNNCSATQLSSMPISFIQSFVFPGGKTFAFKKPRFSNYQDLISDITYVDPTGQAETVQTPKAGDG